MKINLSKLTTEQRNENTKNIGNANSIEIVELINLEDSKIHLEVSKKKNEIAKVIDQCFLCYKNGGRIIYIGAGTSGRLGVLDASEIFPTYGVSNKFIGIIAGGIQAIFKSIEGAEDNIELAIKDLKEINFSKKDFLIGISASGRTPYVISAINYAKIIGSQTGSISTSKESPISKMVDYPIEVVVGPEPITGSTRMKSGTAQKMILNMISTGTMIRAGKVYENLMIDVQPTNEKLVERSKRIIRFITKASDNKIDKIFSLTKSVPLSIIMILKDVDINDAKKIYENENFKWNNF